MKPTSNPLFSRQFFGLLLALAIASLLGAGLLIIRFFLSGKMAHFYLIWNLFLAWVPLGFALLAWRFHPSKGRLLLFGILWLLFFPNAPYLVTDLVHLHERPPVPFWFDVILLQSFIWLALLLGFVALYWMQCLTARFIGWRASWLFVLIVIALTGFGIFLGRVRRWNSWDALLNPWDLTVDILRHLVPPRRRGAGLFSLCYGTFFFIAYVLVYGMAQSVGIGGKVHEKQIVNV